MAQAALLVALAVASLQPQAAPAERYVPETGWTGWARNDEAADFYELWYGGQLRAMGERPLAAPADLGGMRRRFRLLVVPNHGPARAYRFDERPDESVSLHWVQLDGAGGYGPGGVAARTRRVLAPDEARRLAEAVAGAGLEARPRQLPVRDIVDNPDGPQTITFCLHATHYVFERLSADGRLFVTRDMCEVEPPLRRLMRVVFDLGPKDRPFKRSLRRKASRG